MPQAKTMQIIILFLLEVTIPQRIKRCVNLTSSFRKKERELSVVDSLFAGFASGQIVILNQ